jgi:hypothetical protein
MLRASDAEVHPARIDGLEHRFSRSGLALRDTELLERCRPLGPRDGEGLDFALHDIAQLRCNFIRADHAGPVSSVATSAPMSFVATIVDLRLVGL